ncbi:MAG: hypothetical protein IPG35_09845 [Flavobacteriales bacterium]|nr:hypothetical protein [Flavobacteriales bacterium]MBK8947825.1 hypothetical protein [Flavobacteriales bacterium]MBK9700571.1 hypothetical protein [Flavobacteriales bacterium]
MKSLTGAVLAAIVLMASCKKEDDLGSEEVNTMVDHAHAENLIAPLYPLAQALRIGPGHWTPDSATFCMSVDSVQGDTAMFPANGPVTLHLRFNEGGCLDAAGRGRTGPLVLEYDSLEGDGRARLSAFHTSGLECAGFSFRCAASVSPLSDGRHRVLVDSSAIWRQGAWSRRYHGRLDHELIAGTIDGTAGDDVYAVTVEVIGQDRYGTAYTATTSTILEVATGCKWVRGGVLTFVQSDERERTLDYGSGCDARADLTVADTRFGLIIP